jgi:hypothetical protein
MWPEFIVRQARLPMPNKDIKFQVKIYWPIDFLLLEQMPNSNSSAQWLNVQPAILPMRMLAAGSSSR